MKRVDGYAIDFVKLLVNSQSLPAGNVSGHVTEAGTGQPIGGAKVSAFGIITTTDPRGFYTLTNVPAGLAFVEASAGGAMALSHGHYDHTGGLRAVWKLAPNTPLYSHPAILTSRFVRNPDGTCRAVGITKPNLEAIQAHSPQVHHTPASTKVLTDFFLTGEIPRTTDFEEVGSAFVLSETEAQPDPITDDQALFFDTRDGLVVLLGCAHAGVVNTLRHVRRLTNDRPIHAVLGGMHLLTAGPERVMRTVEALRALGVERLGPAHCTGAAATARLWHEFPRACTTCAVGSRFVFHR